jgi:hypothetical protein
VVTEDDIGKTVEAFVSGMWYIGTLDKVGGLLCRVDCDGVSVSAEKEDVYLPRAVLAVGGSPQDPPKQEANYFEKKLDQGKSRVGLIPASALIEVGLIMGYGAVKYEKESWKTVPDAEERYADALLRHTLAILDGEFRDPESGRLHAAHVACNALFLTWFHLKGKR